MSCKGGVRERTCPAEEDVEWLILVDRCRRCGKLNPVFPEKLTKDQEDWLNKRNKLNEKWNRENGVKNCDGT